MERLSGPLALADQIDAPATKSVETTTTHQCSDDDVVEPTAGATGYRRRSIYILLQFQPFGGELEGPREEHRQRKAQSQHQQYGLYYPFRRSEILQRKIGRLGEQPGHYDIGHTDAKYVAAFELDEEVGHGGGL